MHNIHPRNGTYILLERPRTTCRIVSYVYSTVNFFIHIQQTECVAAEPLCGKKRFRVGNRRKWLVYLNLALHLHVSTSIWNKDVEMAHLSSYCRKKSNLNISCLILDKLWGKVTDERCILVQKFWILFRSVLKTFFIEVFDFLLLCSKNMTENS